MFTLIILELVYEESLSEVSKMRLVVISPAPQLLRYICLLQMEHYNLHPMLNTFYCSPHIKRRLNTYSLRRTYRESREEQNISFAIMAFTIEPEQIIDIVFLTLISFLILCSETHNFRDISWNVLMYREGWVHFIPY